MSFARKHMERVLASRAADAAKEQAEDQGEGATMAGRTIYEQMLAQLQTHSAQLKNIQSQEDKIKLKRTFVGDYAAYVDGVLAADSAVQDDVLITQMIWRLDVGMFDAAYQIATHALEHKLTMPERFNRTLPTYIAEEFAEAAIEADGNMDAEAPDVDLLLMVLDDVKDLDMPDQVRAKLHKAVGFGLQASGELENKLEAVTQFTRALQLNKKCGLVKRLEKLERELERATGDT